MKKQIGKIMSFIHSVRSLPKFLVDPDLGTIRVQKIASVMDIGTVMNLKTATNQIMGGILFGMGMALMEETKYDPNNGRIVTRDLAQYFIPVHAEYPGN